MLSFYLSCCKNIFQSLEGVAAVLCTLSTLINYYINRTPELYTAKVLPWPHKEVKWFPYYKHYFSRLQHSKALWLLNYFSGRKSTRGVCIPCFHLIYSFHGDNAVLQLIWRNWRPILSNSVATEKAKSSCSPCCLSKKDSSSSSTATWLCLQRNSGQGLGGEQDHPF